MHTLKGTSGNDEHCCQCNHSEFNGLVDPDFTCGFLAVQSVSEHYRMKKQSMAAAQCLPYFVGQALCRKRLLNEIHTIVQHILMCDNIGCVSGHEKEFDAWMEMHHVLSEIPPVHPRHDYVCQQ